MLVKVMTESHDRPSLTFLGVKKGVSFGSGEKCWNSPNGRKSPECGGGSSPGQLWAEPGGLWVLEKGSGREQQRCCCCPSSHFY